MKFICYIYYPGCPCINSHPSTSFRIRLAPRVGSVGAILGLGPALVIKVASVELIACHADASLPGVVLELVVIGCGGIFCCCKLLTKLIDLILELLVARCVAGG